MRSNGKVASVAQVGNQLLLTNENGASTTATWVDASHFSAWGQTASVVQDGFETSILWNGNAWDQADLSGTWFVRSNGKAASVAQVGDLGCTLTNENGAQHALAGWIDATHFTAWGQTASVVQNGFLTSILWNGNAWDQADLSGTWFVRSNGKAASIAEVGGQLLLTNENGASTLAGWVDASHFTAWGQTASVVQNGLQASILWNGNAWDQADLSGTWFVRSNGMAASIAEVGGQLLLTNENGTSTLAGWVDANHAFTAWGQTASVVQNGFQTSILWNGNAWDQADLSGTWFVRSDGKAASIAEVGNQLLLTSENGASTTATWVDASHFSAWGQTASVVQDGFETSILWNGNAWDQADLSGTWFVRSNGKAASISQVGNQLLLTNENGATTTATWVDAEVTLRPGARRRVWSRMAS